MKIKQLVLSSLICIVSLGAYAETAATPAAPGAATGSCKDGTPYTGATKKGACRGHKGIQEWYADKAAAPAAAASPATATPPPAPATTVSSSAPTNAAATGVCKDGTPYTGETKKGACRGHKGIKEWYADKQAPAASATAVATPTATPAPAAPAAAVAPAKATAPVVTPVKPAETAPAVSGGAGKVWVNTRSKVYHCEGTKFYGKTKDGEYMTEVDAQAKGYTANRKKTCSK